MNITRTQLRATEQYQPKRQAKAELASQPPVDGFSFSANSDEQAKLRGFTQLCFGAGAVTAATGLIPGVGQYTNGMLTLGNAALATQGPLGVVGAVAAAAGVLANIAGTSVLAEAQSFTPQVLALGVGPLVASGMAGGFAGFLGAAGAISLGQPG